jgi:P4 family phage/plasmid primase-like protien
MTLRNLYRIFGHDAVLLPVPRGEKKPKIQGWEKITLAQTKAKSYQQRLTWHAEHANIAVRQGKNLQSIDIDSDAVVTEFLDLNPFLRETTQTKASRGCQFHLRIKGNYPNKKAVYKITHKTERDGNGQPLKVVEWRCGGGGKGSTSIVSGQHPGGARYQCNGKPVSEVEFKKIVWPGVQLPWLNQAAAEVPADASSRLGSVRLAEQDLFKRLAYRYGPPIYFLRKDRPTLNEPFFAAVYAAEHYVLFEADEQKFYEYHAENGLYHFTSEHQIVRWLEQRLLQASRSTELTVLAALRSVRHLVGIVRHLKGQVEEKDPFHGNPNLIHVANGVLDLSGDDVKVLPFSPELKSRNGIPIQYKADATAPMFESKLLPLISPDDRVLLLKFLGQFLTGRNSIQRILILQGLPDTSKSTTAQIAKLLIGERNCTELRTKHLANRFEIGRLYGRTLVIGADVSPGFLNEEGAYRLKAIVGGDMLDAEKKCSNIYFTLAGDFNVLLTANCRLTVRLAGDRGAWERRIAIIDYAIKREGSTIENLAKKLIEKEGSGVLNLALAGLKALRADLKSHGNIVLTDEQRGRTRALLDESDGLRMFLKEKVQTKAGADVTTEEIVREYASYCATREWTMTSAIVEKQLPDLMLELFSVSKSNDIQRLNEQTGKMTDRKGFHGIDWRAEHDEYGDES